PFGHDTLEPVFDAALIGGLAVTVERIEEAQLPSGLEGLRKQLFAQSQGCLSDFETVAVGDIEDVVICRDSGFYFANVHLLGEIHSLLQLLERRAASGVERDYLAVKNDVGITLGCDFAGQCRVLMVDSQSPAGEHLGLAVTDYGQSPHAIKLR